MIPGAAVEIEPTERGVQVVPLSRASELRASNVTVLREGTLLVLNGVDLLSLDDADRAIETERSQRARRMIEVDNDPQ